MEQFRAWAVTHPGTVRDHNEDAYVNRPDLGLWAVADGAGGHDAGEVASGLIATALDSIPLELNAEETLTQVRMRMAATHAALRERAARQGNGMIASTVVVLIARHGHGRATRGHICCATARWRGSRATTAWYRSSLTAARSPTPRRSTTCAPTSSPARSARNPTWWSSTR